MRGSGKNRLESRRDGHALVEADQLGRDLALIVVHHHDAIEFALERAHEDGIRGDGSGAGNSFPSQLVHRRPDDPYLFIAEEAVLAAMRIERGDADAWTLVPHRAQSRVGELDRS